MTMVSPVEEHLEDVALAAGAELDAVNVSAWFGSHKVLERVSLSMPPGIVTALIGPSGCGKSTFLRTLNRMHESIPGARFAGEVRLNGRDIYAVGERVTATRRAIGMVFQKPNPFPAMSIADNVAAGLTTQRHANVSAGQRRPSGAVTHPCRAVERGKGPARARRVVHCPVVSSSGSASRDRSPSTQRFCLMDEPCSALDPGSTNVIERTIHELRDEVTIVIVTHNMQQAARVSQQCAFFLATDGRPGGIVECGDTEQIFDRPSRPTNGRLRPRSIRLGGHECREIFRRCCAAVHPA